MKRYLTVILFAIFLYVVYVGCLLIVDPYRIFHNPWVRDDYFVPDMRRQASGIINNVNFDSVILGTSMAENFSPKEASMALGGQFVNLSFSGAALVERSIVLNYVLRHKKLSTVLISLDGLEKDMVSNTPIALYAYLYDANRLNDIQIYSSDINNAGYLLCKNGLISSNKLCKKTKDLENITEWWSGDECGKRFGGLNKWLEVNNDPQINAALKDISKSIRAINANQTRSINWQQVTQISSKQQRVFNDYLLGYISANPQVKFYLFFPPYSRLKFAIMKQSKPQEFEIYLKTLRLILSESANYKNVQVFGFETESFLDDVANYMDTGHYHQNFNSKILQWMGKDQHELTMSNVDEYIASITKLAANYPLEGIGHQIDSYVQ